MALGTARLRFCKFIPYYIRIAKLPFEFANFGGFVISGRDVVTFEIYWDGNFGKVW